LLLALVPTATLHRLDGRGHLLPLDAPVQVVEAIVAQRQPNAATLSTGNVVV